MSAVEGRCHCGAAGYTVPAAPNEVTVCNCSLCTKLGGRWAYYDPAEVEIEGETVAYVRADLAKPYLATHHCPRCGATTHWAARDPDYRRMGVNVRLMEPDLLKGVAVRHCDGRSWTEDD